MFCFGHPYNGLLESLAFVATTRDSGDMSEPDVIVRPCEKWDMHVDEEHRLRQGVTIQSVPAVQTFWYFETNRPDVRDYWFECLNSDFKYEVLFKLTIRLYVIFITG